MSDMYDVSWHSLKSRQLAVWPISVELCMSVESWCCAAASNAERLQSGAGEFNPCYAQQNGREAAVSKPRSTWSLHQTKHCSFPGGDTLQVSYRYAAFVYDYCLWCFDAVGSAWGMMFGCYSNLLRFSWKPGSRFTNHLMIVLWYIVRENHMTVTVWHMTVNHAPGDDLLAQIKLVFVWCLKFHWLLSALLFTISAIVEVHSATRVCFLFS